MEELRTWSGPVASLLAIGGIIYTWLTASSKANEGKITDHEEKLIEHDRRIQSLESELKHLPSKDDFNGLLLAVEQVKSGLGRLEESHDGVKAAMRRIEEYLLREKP
ncbi:DUF2730 family protein [Phyllobacterium leguminum]|uniref:Uncharacterized protein DUF2730 n=1 Tax=Phyllobacterium leguminum TaxID=314237 RepID=A0A318T257_9HYPH|nr:DUF2730 family protein [Phyllobacterium leguminum]PYE86897.1 uncharacterized protein DUF2730 [Phyllobacterium leguminum]